MIISNFLFLKFFLNLSKLLLFAVSQFKNVILFDLYLNLKFLSRPYICAFLKYLAKEAKDAPSHVPISKKLNFFSRRCLKFFS